MNRVQRKQLPRGNTLGNVDIQAEAEKILRSLEGDVELVPSNIAFWWINYLHSHYYRYLDTLLFLDKNDMKKKILEIGSVPGHFTVLLKKLGFNVRGVDIDPTRVKRFWDKYNVYVDKVDIERESLPFSSDSFDIVLFTEMLEHLRLDPLHALREVYRLLKSTGRIIFSTPNVTLVHRLRFLFGKSFQGNPVEEFKKLEWLGHMGHIRLYSLEEVKGFLEYVGFKICSYTYKGKMPSGWKAKIIMLMYPKKEHFKSCLYVIAKKE